MCGIVGVVEAEGTPVAPTVLRRMCDTLSHRGPDDEGMFIDSSVGLGHRRLSIIDLSTAGRQPLSSPDGRFVMVYNGEIYNYQELRVELSGLGHRFQSRTDSEVVLHAYMQWGRAAVSRFNGMFALAIWDRADGSVFIARDRYGIKPVYYWQDDQRFIFASEIKAILNHPGAHAAMNREGLVEYLAFQNFFTENTLFKGIRTLPAGTMLTVDPRRVGSAKPERYWDYRFQSDPAITRDRQACVEELDRLLQQAVGRQLMSDVPVGSYLSGGLDSGTLTALAAKQLPYINTFTVGFDLNSVSGVELAYDERQVAEHMSYLFRTEHYEMVLKAGDMERCMRDLVWHLEEPRVGQSYPNFYAAKLASKFVKVVLSGTGGDEIFAGYPWRYYRAARATSADAYLDKYFGFWQRLLPGDELASVLAPIAADVRDVRPRDIMDNIFKGSGIPLETPEDYINSSLYFEAKTFLHGLLVVEDKLSMAHSLESRVPFLDNDLVDFAMKLPVSYKLGNFEEVLRADEGDLGRYVENTRDGKMILREAIARHVPASVSQGRKQGFSAPDSTWFRGESMEYVRGTLLNKNAAIYNYLDRTTVEKLISEHLAGQCNRRLLIWSLLNLEEWCKVYLKAAS
ncbi:asparagine synthase (glutamine-hydrolyzing) [Sphingoaurantiacus capsulatus]|uniref:asparagine synthase (glutamine-hydrolyzing) n=1 Tax=Sphingoaurantiacus capsulatus TaxID=1771310 RepID=A0ABV7XAG7_9SPHN